VLREGRSTVAQLADAIVKSDIVLIISAADVILLEVIAPPMSEAKFKLALPSLLEEQLMCDPAECVFIPLAKHIAKKNSVRQSDVEHEQTAISQMTPVDVGKRVVAVVQRSWLQQLSASLFALGARQMKAVPEQLCLPFDGGGVGAKLVEDQHEGCANVALRFSPVQGMGMLLASHQSPLERLMELVMLAPVNLISLQVPEEMVAVFQPVLAAHPDLDARINLHVISWKSTLTSMHVAELNLMSGLNTAQKNQIHWKNWRWPLALAVTALLVNLVGVNLTYWRLKSEAQALKQQIAQTYKINFPKETVVPFPLEQMRKNLVLAKRRAGQSSSDDFTLLLSQFGSAWGSMPSDKQPKILSIEYKQQALTVLVDGTLNQDQFQQILSVSQLSLSKLNAGSWQIRKIK